MTDNVLVLLADGSRIPLRQFASRFGKQLISMRGANGNRISDADATQRVRGSSGWTDRRQKSA
jgi:hypothetical protein